MLGKKKKRITGQQDERAASDESQQPREVRARTETLAPGLAAEKGVGTDRSWSTEESDSS